MKITICTLRYSLPWRALDADDELIADPTVMWVGVMDQMNLTVGADGGDAIQLTAESELARFDKASNRKYTDSQLQADFPGALAFEFMPDIEGTKIRWGSADSEGIIGGGGGSSSPERHRPTYER